MSTQSPSLDDLFREAKAQIILARRAKEQAAMRKQAELASPDTKALFADPANWTRVGGVALIHADTETLLGQFAEYVHKSVPNCRKLIREHGPLTIYRTERVEGSWWLGEQTHVEPRQPWHEKRSAIIDLRLDTLHLHAPMCEVVAHLSHGGIARVELAQDTQLAGQDEQLLFLPAGTDVLALMSLASKVALRVELGA